ncbi:ABC transporter permease [Cellulosilyticum sp. I15G10I2]|uniref:ABC transporter permease n=1 Tax=Cellulosilyticum sp. I15G10I2 TaxID=1892843 RepID=UPI00085BE03F|nr:ABC transporter permease [Cellulosilyticum sp. I15G10I2]
MRNIYNIAKHSVRMFFNNQFSILLLVAPIFVTVLLVMMLSGNKFSSGAQIGVVRSEKTVGVQVFLEEMGKELNITYLDEKTARAYLEQKKINGILIIRTDNLLRDLMEGKKNLEVIGVGDDPVIEFIVAQLERALSSTYTFAKLSSANESKFEALYATYKSEIKEVKVDQSDFEMIRAVIVFGMFVMIFLFTCIKSLQAMAGERESKIYERICISSIKHYEYVSGHILGAYGILMIQMIIQGIIMNALGLTFGLRLFSFIGICMVLGVVGLSLSLVILACTKNTQGYFVVGSFVISPLCMLSGCIFPKEFLPDIVNKVALLSPVRWVMTLYNAVITGASFEEIFASVLVALGLSIVLVLMGMATQNSRKMMR